MSVAIPRIDEYVTLGIATNEQEPRSSSKPLLHLTFSSCVRLKVGPKTNKIRALAKRLLILQQQHDSSTWTQYNHHTKSSTQFQRCNFSSDTPSKYRAPFLGYFSKSCAISARFSVDSSTSPALRFSRVRFTFLHGTSGVNDQLERQEMLGRDGGRSYTHEDPGSGMMWLPRAPTQAILSWAIVMPLRFAIFVKWSTSWRLWPIFFVRDSRVCQPR